jgi:DNA-binding NtrC family response regulator
MTQPLDILFVEDTLSDFLLVLREVRNAGLLGDYRRVEEREGLNDALRERPWDIVLSDYAMPGLLFTETLGRIRREFPDLPVILVSGTIGEVKAAVMVKLGAWDFVPKYDLARLVPAIEGAMRRLAAMAPRYVTDSTTLPPANSPGRN